MSHFRLRFFFDAGSGVCLWSADVATRAQYDVAVMTEQLPLRAATRQEVARLLAWYDTSLDWDNPAGPTPWSPEECTRFNAAVRSLLARLRRELAPTVIEDEFQPVRPL